jgi:hypothetical protein
MIGFHGCDMETRDKIVLHQDVFKKSINPYDWLGNGAYFWENDYERALQWAKERSNNPGVIGALIERWNCLDLLEQESRENLKLGYEILKEYSSKKSIPMPKNRMGKDHLLRDLDCVVINYLCEYSLSLFGHEYDTVRGAFWEGTELYPGTSIKESDHIQICVRNLDCIKAVFIP